MDPSTSKGDPRANGEAAGGAVPRGTRIEYAVTRRAKRGREEDNEGRERPNKVKRY